MRILLFGATGMVGQSALLECLNDEAVSEVLTVGRTKTELRHPKLRQIEVRDVGDLSMVESELASFDACLFCLGVSSAGMREEDYRKITYDLTMSVAKTLARLNPGMTFLYVTGSGTDSSERGRVMWARVKGKTENDLLRLPFRAAYMLRPGVILPMNGVRSKTRLYQAMYDVMKPLNPLLAKLPIVITSEQLGKAMLRLARDGYSKPVLESAEIKRMSRPDAR